MAESRYVDEVHVTVCENGHVVSEHATGRKVRQILHACGKWTGADGHEKFCSWCGKPLTQEERAVDA
jgi:hypothetical protein